MLILLSFNVAIALKKSKKNAEKARAFSPNRPGAPKPSRNNMRRRSSYSGSAVGTFELQKSSPNDLKGPSDVNYTMDKKDLTKTLLRATANPSTYSTCSEFATPGLKESCIEEKNPEQEGCILVYDDADKEVVEEMQAVERSRKTLRLIKSIKNDNNNVSEPHSGSNSRPESAIESLNASRPGTRDKRALGDVSNWKNKEVVLEDDMGLIYRLRRMVPPGRHSYVFAVGHDFSDGLDNEGSNTVIDFTQPRNLATAALSQESISFARAQGVSLPEYVNTIFMFKNELLRGQAQVHGRKNVPTALVLANKLCHSVNPKPRCRYMPTLGNRKKLWNRMESVLYKQWLLHQKKYMMECCYSDWRLSSIYALLMTKTSNDHERQEIFGVIKEHYATLKVCKHCNIF